MAPNSERIFIWIMLILMSSVIIILSSNMISMKRTIHGNYAEGKFALRQIEEIRAEIKGE